MSAETTAPKQTAHASVFAELLTAWNQHEDLKVGRAPIAQLSESRLRLDQARLSAALTLAA